MKKSFLLLLLIFFCTATTGYAVDKTSAEYLKNKKHFAIMNPLAESIAQKIIKKSIKKETTRGKFKVKFDGYTLSSMKNGVFKNLEIIGKDFQVEGIDVPYARLKTITDYNRIDFNQDPVAVKTDIVFAYDTELTETSINQALAHNEYKKSISKINKKAYPLFKLHDSKIRIRNNKIYIIMDYSLPLATNEKVKTFMVSTSFKAENGKIIANNVGIDKSYGNIPINKVTNLINLLDPLSFTLKLINDDDCNAKIENVKIVDNIVQISGKIFIKGE